MRVVDTAAFAADMWARIREEALSDVVVQRNFEQLLRALRSYPTKQAREHAMWVHRACRRSSTLLSVAVLSGWQHQWQGG